MTLSYPGVYVQEVPSGVRTIAGVATSITAFIGRARRGPVDQATTIHSFGEFERIYGGLWESSVLGHAVRDFFVNGGATAIIVRVFRPDPPPAAPAPVPPVAARIDVGTFLLEASSAGTWGNQLRVRVDYDTLNAAGTADADTFNLFVRDGVTGVVETHRAVSVLANHGRRADLVLARDSALVRVRTLGAARPTASGVPAAGADPWIAATSTGVTTQVTEGQALDETALAGVEANKTGMFALQQVDLFNLLCVPSATTLPSTFWDSAASYCQRRRAFLIVDPPTGWRTRADAVGGVPNVGASSNYAALFFPRLRQPNPLLANRIEEFPPCGAVAGVFARTDAERGVWKAPAGLDAELRGVPELTVNLTDAENGDLNPLGVNCLRIMPASGRVVWGSRTRHGDDRRASEWKYVPVRRTALFIEESLFRGTQWVVFEPNSEALWAQIRLNVGAFMNSMFRQGAFQGRTPREAYFVKCDGETTTQTDINLGIVNVVVGFAPLKPAEFVVLRIQQISGDIPT